MEALLKMAKVTLYPTWENNSGMRNVNGNSGIYREMEDIQVLADPTLFAHWGNEDPGPNYSHAVASINGGKYKPSQIEVWNFHVLNHIPANARVISISVEWAYAKFAYPNMGHGSFGQPVISIPQLGLNAAGNAPPKDVVTAFQTLQSGLDLVTNLFDSLGMEGAANAAGDAGGILGGALQGASSLSALGPYGMAAGAALGLVSGIAQTHDKALERQIGKLREDVQKIEANTKLIQQARERTLGLDTGILRSIYAQQYAYGGSKAQRDMYSYYTQNTSGNGYQQELNNLIQQRKDYLEILDKQEAKKKKSQSDIEETKGKIAELDDQIRFFSQDLAKELFDIDIKGWADQLGDALASAFENGESMAKAYSDTVTSILQNLAQKMLKTAYLEKMFESLQDKLFGPNGVVDPTDMQGSMSKATAVISDFFGKGGEGEQTITAATEFMTAFQRGLENSGLSLLNDSGKTLSASVQGTSEETSDLLAGYVNALRQDVSINRLLLTEFITQLWPSYYEEFTNHVRTVARIDTNVQVVMEMMRDGRGAMYEEISAMRSRIDNVVNGIESFAMK